MGVNSFERIVWNNEYLGLVVKMRVIIIGFIVEGLLSNFGKSFELRRI